MAGERDTPELQRRVTDEEMAALVAETKRLLDEWQKQRKPRR